MIFLSKMQHNNTQMTKKLSSLILLFLLIAGTVQAQLTKELKERWNQMHKSKELALKEFNEAKFGLFIHWGLYSRLAGEWKGQKIPGLGEWIMYHAMIPRADYGKLAKEFNPVQFNAEQWVLATKDAGMKYIIITSKHHDGFSMYSTKISKYNIVYATPFKRDPIDELYNACKKNGIRFGVYYSQIIDWYDGWDGGMLRANRKMADLDKENPMNTWDPDKTTREMYLQNKSLPQVKELIAKYPDMLEMWFDYWYEGEADKYNTPQTSFQFYKTLYDASPKCLVSSRIGSGLGDFAAAGDNEILSGSKMAYWETPGTVNNTWGYSKFDNDWKTLGEIIFWIVDIASKGGNYLLNVGPKADGTIPAESLKLLSGVGKWMKIHGEAIYGTKKWELSHEGPTNLSMKGTDDREKNGFNKGFSHEDFWFSAKDNVLYVTALKWPESKQVLVKSLARILADDLSKIRSLTMLGSTQEISWKTNPEGLLVSLPSEKPNLNGYVLKITFRK